AHSPALVSQGKIGAVIAAKPVERRQLLEEAAGISGLHARRKDAEQKLRATEANLTRLGEILGEQEQRASQLRRQARAAERYRKLTDQIRAVEAHLLHARWTEAERSAEAANAEAAAADRQVAAIQTAIAAAQAAQERAAIEQRLADAEARGARIAAELTKAESESREAEAGLADLLARQAAMRAERRVAEAAFEAARAQLARTEQEDERLSEQLRALG